MELDAFDAEGFEPLKLFEHVGRIRMDGAENDEPVAGALERMVVGVCLGGGVGRYRQDDGHVDPVAAHEGAQGRGCAVGMGEEAGVAAELCDGFGGDLFGKSVSVEINEHYITCWIFI